MKARLIFLLSIKIVIISIFFACSSSPKETEKTSSLCYRSAFYVADDGWVYEFDNQYRSDVPMKDSGIEWIGMIPEHWGVAKLANLFTSLGGYAFNSDLYVSETENLIVRIGNVKNDRLLFDANPVYISDDLAEQVIKFKMQCGDILFTMTGTKGKRDYFYTLILDNSHIQTKNLYLNQRVGCFRKKAHIHAEYYNYLLKDNRILDSIFLYETGTANQGNLGIDSINRTKVHLPPYQGHSLSVSDIVEVIGDSDEVEPGSYFVDSIGFKKLPDFDSAQCAEMDGLRMLMIQPHRTPIVTYVKDDLASLQRAVSDHCEESYIEYTYPFEDDCMIWDSKTG